METKMKKNITIKDIAKLAGVSAGTVDRVINKRGNVSIDSEKKVKDVLGQVDFHPNVLARSLSQKKRYNIAIVIPSFSKGEYWETVSQGMDIALSDYAQYNIFAKKIYFDQYDRNSFRNACESVLNQDFNGVIFAPMFTTETLLITSHLENFNIPYIFIDSDIPQSKPLSYFGIDSRISGKIGAISMMNAIGKGANILMIKAAEHSNASNQSILREQGFIDEIGKSIDKTQIISVTISQDIEESNLQLDGIFRDHNIHGVVTFNSKAYLFSDYLKFRNIKPMWVLGFDTIQRNVSALKNGYITLLIGQHPGRQGTESISSMSRFLLENIKPERLNYKPIDLLIKENIDYYLMNE